MQMTEFTSSEENMIQGLCRGWVREMLSRDEAPVEGFTVNVGTPGPDPGHV